MIKKKFELIPKMPNIYPNSEISKTVIHNFDEILDMKLSNIHIRMKEPIINKFATYIVNNYKDIIDHFVYGFKGKTYVINDSRFPLYAYMTDKINFVINFPNEIRMYTNEDILAILIYGIFYINYILNEKKLKPENYIYNQVKQLSILFMSMFGKKYGIMNDIELVEKSYVLFGAHVCTNYWGLRFNDYIGKIVEYFKLDNISRDTLEKISKIDINPKNFDNIKFINLLSQELFDGISISIIVSELSKISFSMESAFESLDRILPFNLPILISPNVFGKRLFYLLPEKELYTSSLRTIKDFIATSPI